MENWFTKVQPLAVVGGSSDVPKWGSPAQQSWNDAAGNTYWSGNVVLSSGTAAFSGVAPRVESQLLRKTFSSVPLVWQSEIAQEYQELGAALGEMTRLDEDDEWRIDSGVYQVACQVASELWANSYPAPQVFNHGPQSVVFNWSSGDSNLYLTISSDFVSALLSSPERIKRRIEFSNKDILEPALVFGGLLSVHYDQPVASIVRASSQTPDDQPVVSTFRAAPQAPEFAE